MNCSLSYLVQTNLLLLHKSLYDFKATHIYEAKFIETFFTTDERFPKNLN